MGIDLSLIWAAIIAFGIMMYVIMDGFDLGIGMLYLFVPDKHNRDVMMNTVAPVWDGNETWLVLGGAGLMAAFSAGVLGGIERAVSAADFYVAGFDFSRRRVRVSL